MSEKMVGREGFDNFVGNKIGEPKASRQGAGQGRPASAYDKHNIFNPFVS